MKALPPAICLSAEFSGDLPAESPSTPNPPNEDSRLEFAAFVREGLRDKPKRLDPRHFYDGLGSALFTAITRLPWYRLSELELTLLAQAGEAITRSLDGPLALIELGPGDGEKLARLAAPLCRRQTALSTHLIDISPAALATAASHLATIPQVQVSQFAGDYSAGLRALPDFPGLRRLLCFLGSNLGNFEPATALEFLREIRAALRSGDGLLLGVDLIKPESELLIAYDDPLGVTAAFNKNLLLRINRELGGEFDLTRFVHRAHWNAPLARIEMHLDSVGAQRVRIAALDETFPFTPGEAIWTESSHKYSVESLAALAGAAGFRAAGQWQSGPTGVMESLWVVAP